MGLRYFLPQAAWFALAKLSMTVEPRSVPKPSVRGLGWSRSEQILRFKTIVVFETICGSSACPFREAPWRLSPMRAWGRLGDICSGASSPTGESSLVILTATDVPSMSVSELPIPARNVARVTGAYRH